MSTAILKLSENGELQRIHDKWLMRSACSSQDTKLEVDRLQLKSFWGLFLICGVACLLALIIYFMQIVCQFYHYYSDFSETSSGQSSRSGRIQAFLSFVNEKEEVIMSRSKRGSDGHIEEGASMNGVQRRHVDASSNENGSLREI